MRAREKNNKGFSLLELIIVVVIMGIMSTLAFTPFQNWRTERIVRNESERISNVIRSIYSQVQRGVYSFVQFQISEDDGKITISSNGMKAEKFAKFVRNKYNDAGHLQDFHKFDTRCIEDGVRVDDDTVAWDDEGLTSSELTVDKYEIDEDLSITIPGKTEIIGTICFSKEGSYYGAGEGFLKGTGSEAQAIEELYICSGTSGCGVDDMGEGPENFFRITWSRFGNIGLDKWFYDKAIPAESRWVAQ